MSEAAAPEVECDRTSGESTGRLSQAEWLLRPRPAAGRGSSPSRYLLYPALFVLGLITGGTIQLRAQALTDYFGRGVVGSVTGYSLVGQTLTTASAPLFLGVVRDATGSYVWGLVTFALFCLVAGFVFMLAHPPRRRHATD